jgi:2-dehydro-3-deoxygluconokinase
MAEFITIGEALVVLVSKDIDKSLEEAENFKKFVAGAELNVAMGMARLGHEALFLSKVGDDPFGRFILRSATEAGLDTASLKIDPNFLTGFYLKQNVSQGDPTVAYFRKNSAAANLTAEEIEFEIETGIGIATTELKALKIAHLSGIFAALSSTCLRTFKAFNRRLNNEKVLTVFDPNLRPALWRSYEEMINVTNDLAKGSQIILPGINEGEILMGSRNPEKIADFYLSQSEFTRTVVVKLGAAGAYVKSRSGKYFTVSGFKVEKVINTVGAGDGFAVGLESALLEDKPLEVAVHRACAVGAMAVQTLGDNDGYPTREQLQKFYLQQNYKGDI